MKNSILIFIILLLFKSLASANELDISAKNISIDKKNQIAENYNNKCKNKGKKFNWNTKTHYS